MEGRTRWRTNNYRHSILLKRKRGEENAKILAEGALSTATIDLNTLFSRSLTTSGSFDIESAIWGTTFGKLVEALPIPAVLIHETYRALFTN